MQLVSSPRQTARGPAYTDFSGARRRLQKSCFSGGYPILRHFLAILGILAEITGRYWKSTEVKAATRTVHTPLGVTAEVM